jgi:hypothetical protein
MSSAQSLRFLWLSMLFCIVVAFFYYPKWTRQGTEATLSWDVSGYYMYLPALFIYNDLDQVTFGDSIIRKYYPTPDFQQVFHHYNSGNKVMKYSCGQAIAMLPFFLVGHAMAAITDHPSDGFSAPYQCAIGIGMVLYTLIGLYFFYLVMMRYYSPLVTSIVIGCLVLGTNYLNYAAIDQAMPHNTLFAIYAMLIYASIRFYEKPGYGRAIIIGALIGWAALIRPTEIVSAIIPLLWGVASLRAIGTRIKQLFVLWKYILVAGVVMGLIGMIQLTYWKVITNEWLVYSYQDQGFSWTHPHVFQYAFSYCCGWLRYCPLMILAIIGLLPFVREHRNTIAVLLFTAVNYYIVSAWDEVHYGGMSGRAMIQSYPVLLFGLASLVAWVQTRPLFKYILYALLAFCIYLNIWWTHNAHRGEVPVFTNATKEYYWQAVGRWKMPIEKMALLDNKYLFDETPASPIVLAQENFEQDSGAMIVPGIEGKSSLLNAEHQFAKEFFFSKEQVTQQKIRASADFRCETKEWNIWQQSQFILRFYHNDQVTESCFLRVHRFLSDGETKRLQVDCIAPSSEWDKMGVLVWHAGGQKVLLVDNLEVINF